jgi:hypothetical protein
MATIVKGLSTDFERSASTHSGKWIFFSTILFDAKLWHHDNRPNDAQHNETQRTSKNLKTNVEDRVGRQK